jgi:hypothetical protein
MIRTQAELSRKAERLRAPGAVLARILCSATMESVGFQFLSLRHYSDGARRAAVDLEWPAGYWPGPAEAC